ncbi:hypothetical protein HY386_02565 [Candidatus Daviesbacteria bacterium]|nr:hypothetical protein [Candidatus Daviesbacteria bacterium]
MTIIKKFDTSEYQENSWRKSKYWIPFGALLVSLTLAEIWANNTMVTYGERFETMSRIQNTLQMENQLLENEIAKQTALSNVASESAAFGFSKSESIQYIR